MSSGVAVEDWGGVGPWVVDAECRSTCLDAVTNVITARYVAPSLCGPCPVLDACGEHGDRMREWGLWGGKWRAGEPDDQTVYPLLDGGPREYPGPRTGVTPEVVEVARLTAAGRSARLVAAELRLATRTVIRHRQVAVAHGLLPGDAA